jgi:superkiller protein 3
MSPNLSYTYAFMGVALNRQGKYEEAIAAFNKAIEIEGRDIPAITGRLGASYAKLGQRDKAMTVLHQFEGLSKQRYIPKTSLAALYVALGDTDKGLELLEQAYEERDGILLVFDFKCVPFPDEISINPRLLALRKKLGLN